MDHPPVRFASDYVLINQDRITVLVLGDAVADWVLQSRLFCVNLAQLDTQRIEIANSPAMTA